MSSDSLPMKDKVSCQMERNRKLEDSVEVKQEINLQKEEKEEKNDEEK